MVFIEKKNSKIARTLLAVHLTAVPLNNVSLSPYNNINNLRVYYKPRCLLCRKELVCFLGSHSNSYLVNGCADQFPVSVLLLL